MNAVALDAISDELPDCKGVALLEPSNGCAVLHFKPGHQLSHTWYILYHGAALTAAPDVSPGFQARAAEIHFRLVGTGQIVRIESRLDDARTQVVAVNAGE